jgi:hypothetical protein
MPPAAALAALLPLTMLAAPVRSRPAPRAFVAGPTQVEGPLAEQPVPGFEKTTRKIRRAPQSSGRIEFSAPPASLRAGEDYQVAVYLVNQGGKPVTVRDVDVALLVNGRRTAQRVPPRTATVKRGERALLHEQGGRWPVAARSWTLRVLVTAVSGDSYRSQLAWK